MTGSAGSAVDVLVNAIAFFNRRRVREEDRRRFCWIGGSADDGKRSEAEWTLCNAGIKGEGGSGGRGYRHTAGPDRIGGRRIGKKWFQKSIFILHDLEFFWGPKMA